MKLNNKNLNTFGKYFIMVLMALMVYRMAMPVVESFVRLPRAMSRNGEDLVSNVAVKYSGEDMLGMVSRDDDDQVGNVAKLSGRSGRSGKNMWRLKDQNYDCTVIKAKDEPGLAKVLGNNAKRVRRCKDGKYKIVN